MADEPRCPMCEGGEAAIVMRGAHGYPILRCGACGLVYTDARDAPPSQELYPAFDQSDTATLRRVRGALAVFLRQRAALVRAVKPAGRLLDFGCGAGAFARYMAERGYETVGLEPVSLGAPRRLGSLTLLRQPLDGGGDIGQFDVITLWQVLEHLPRPVETLRALARHLKPDGAMVISVPNYGSLQRKVFGGSWFHLDPPRHLLHFDAETLRGCLARAGLAPTTERRFLPEYGTSGWVQSTLNRLLPHSNYLYELVKDRGALRGMSPVSSALHLVGSVAAGVPVLLLSFPLEAAASALGQNAALTVAARLDP
jgi:SAM-dependent methyltransferase